MPDLSALPDGTRVFVDTNIFHFHFQGKSASCTALLRRIARGEVEAYVNMQVLVDLLHKLMVAEAIAKKCTKDGNPQGLKSFLKRCRGNPNPLVDYQAQFENVLAMGLHVLPINEKLLVATRREREQFYLMTGDSLHLGCMNRCILHRRKIPLSNIATMDGDFASIPGLTVWKPDEIP